MTKAELLADLSGRDGIIWVGTPSQTGGAPEGSDATFYEVQVLEAVGNTATAKNVRAIVLDDGGPGEDAYYFEAAPAKRTRPSAMKEWFLSVLDANADNYKGIQMLWYSERYEMAIYAILTANGDDLEQTVYYVRKGGGAPKKIVNFDIDLLASLFNV